MNNLETQSFDYQSNQVLFTRIVIGVVNAIAVLLIITLLNLSYIRGGDKVLMLISGVLGAICLVTWTMWPVKK